MSQYPYAAFSGYGIEIEHMIVDAETLDVKPIADELLKSAGGGYDIEVERGAANWSNELALHVIEMKTAGIVTDFAAAARTFREQVDDMNARLVPLGARLLPGGMHPWMNPDREMRLWPHENDVIYRTFDRIFDCRGHGWANLQSVHINLPFQDDAEFERVHAAARVILPLIPALCASSPFVEGARAPELDHRIAVYRHNARRVPSVSGSVIPERVFSRASYERDLLERIYDDLRPLDPEETLLEEWVNARGAIARFDRGAVEIRLIDTQECPEQDLAVVALVTAVVRALAEERFAPLADLKKPSEHELLAVLVPLIERGSAGVVDDRAFLSLFGLDEPLRARDLWQKLALRTLAADDPAWPGLRVIFEHGTLAERLVAATESNVARPSAEALKHTYARLADALRTGHPFVAR